MATRHVAIALGTQFEFIFDPTLEPPFQLLRLLQFNIRFDI